MQRTYRIASAAAALAVVAGCSQSDWDHFRSEEGDWGSGGVNGLCNHSISSPGACRRSGATWNHGSGGCWRI